MRKPERTVPRAVLFALAVVTAVYLLVQVGAQGVLGLVFVIGCGLKLKCAHWRFTMIPKFALLILCRWF